ncbi:acyl-CoA dehydrogenase [Nocardioides sp. Soil777]|uniref:acyl-CoA dehydrogenase n=1 Tax=Nocardioides sp. Soil777 TaxID=1736409 RepID=UPI0007038B10|nr:acyl-CoA dehydrogenase [Nocardioides sp. Soil777]KRF05868.1 acyl-CoA dehydrogenase [Nocardioides sp. Soil777]
MSQIMSRRDLEFLLFEWLDTERLFERTRYAEHSRDVVEDLLGLAERIATDHFAPHNRAADLAEPRFDGERVELVPEVEPALRAFADAGFLAAPLSEEAGGLQLPSSVFGACMAWFHAANVGTAGYALLTLANANLLTVHATPELVGLFVEPMTTGRFFGTMALSEPHAGSNLADITTRAEPQPDGTYRLFGRKMWISGGDHEMGDNIVHLVLARTPDAPLGTRGISLFLVPKYLVDEDGTVGERNDVVLAGINHKMGFRGTVNTAPIFGDGAFTPGGRPGAVGHLVGTEHRGLPAMFTMMNEARIGVGLGATALGYTGYLKSLAYARERLQGRPLGASPESPQVPLVEHPDVRRMLLAQKSYVEGALALNLYCSRLVDDIASLDDAAVTAEAEKLLGVLTPIAKSWPSQWCLAANDLAIQVLGGAGYTRDHDVEQHYRDNRLNAIHEGTHGIQGLDLLGRKVLMDAGAGLSLLVGRIHETARRASGTGDADGERYAAQLAAAAERLVEVTGAIATRGDQQAMLADATAYLEAAGHLVVAWLWLEQWLVADGKEGVFYDGKRSATAYFFGRELPKIAPMLDLLADGDRTTLDLDPGVL